MKLFNVTFLLHSSRNECYVVAEDSLKAEELVLSTYYKKYNSSFITIKQVEHIADTNYVSPLTDLIIEERSEV